MMIGGAAQSGALLETIQFPCWSSTSSSRGPRLVLDPVLVRSTERDIFFFNFFFVFLLLER